MNSTKFLRYVMVLIFSLNIATALADDSYLLPEAKVMTIDKSLLPNQVEEMKLAAQNYAAFWDTGEEVYAKKALAEDFIDLN